MFRRIKGEENENRLMLINTTEKMIIDKEEKLDKMIADKRKQNGFDSLVLKRKLVEIEKILERLDENQEPPEKKMYLGGNYFAPPIIFFLKS